MPVIYIDVLFCVNFLMNLLILWVTEKAARIRVKEGWLFLGAGIGALYAVLMFFPRLSVFYTVLAKILCSLFLIAVTFRLKTVRMFLKTVLIFYLVSFAFGGGALALFYFTDFGIRLGAVLSNGVFYFTLPWKVLFLSAVILSVLLRLGARFLSRRTRNAALSVPVQVEWNGKRADLNALLDTGNTLSDPLTDRPVLVAEYDAVRDLLPSEVCSMYEAKEKTGREQLMNVWMESETPRPFRVIPFTSLGRENGMLVGFSPDRIIISENEREYIRTDVIIGISEQKLSKNRQYNALVSPETVTEE